MCHSQMPIAAVGLRLQTEPMDALSDQAEARRREAKAGRAADRRPITPFLRHSGWAVAAVLLIGFNLRPSITTVALFLANIKHDLGIPAFAISVLTMLPVICLGVFAPAAPILARRFGLERILFVSLLGITIGSLVRSLGVAPLYLGTAVIGASLCFLGVLTPALVKRDFPAHIGLMMGLYTMMICIGPALSAATAVPFQQVLGGSWQLVLIIWGLPALVGALTVVPRLFVPASDIRLASPRLLGMVRDPLAWQVTAYFGLISALAYAVFNWGPSMLQARGLDAAQSGLILSVCYISQTFAGLLAPIVAGKKRDQRLIIAAMVVLTALGLLGFVYAPVSSLEVVAFMLGIGQGGAFGVALLLFALRSRDPQSASELSAMAQTVGYIFGGIAGPFAVGIIYDHTGSWAAVSLFYVAVGLASLVCGVGAGRARTVRSAKA
jgi:MFS transporter, CP family, cyanate transporter